PVCCSRSKYSYLILRPPQPRRSSLFPYTTLFRSVEALRRLAVPSPPELGLPDDDADLAVRDELSPSRQRAASRIDRGHHLVAVEDRKSTRLNSSHVKISYAVFCLKKKKSTYETEA